jgi:hypothetical protein
MIPIVCGGNRAGLFCSMRLVVPAEQKYWRAASVPRSLFGLVAAATQPQNAANVITFCVGLVGDIE